MGCAESSCKQSCCSSTGRAAPTGRVTPRLLGGVARYVTSFEATGIAPPPFARGRPPDPERIRWLDSGPQVPWPDLGLPHHAKAFTKTLVLDPSGTSPRIREALRIKIYINAGPLDSGGGLACRHLNTSGCNLYEIDWPIPPGTPAADLGTYIRKLATGPDGVRQGIAKPEVHGTRPVVAYGYTDSTLPAPDTTRTAVVDLVSGLERSWGSGNPPVSYAAAWGAGDELWYNLAYRPVPTDPRYEALWSTQVTGLGYSDGMLNATARQQWFPEGEPVRAAGYCSFGWPAINPANPDLMAIQQVWGLPLSAAELDKIAAPCPFYAEELGEYPPTPSLVQFPAIGVVFDVATAASRAAGKVSPWSLHGSPEAVPPYSWWQVGFVRGSQYDPSRDQPMGLAHADWSPRGDEVAFFEQEGPTLDTGREVARTYGFRLDGSRYESVRVDPADPSEPIPLYEHPEAADLPPPANAFADSCLHYLHKYARYLGTPGDARESAALPATMMVVSVACEEDAGEGAGFVRPSLLNRIYLVDFTDANHPIYEDLTTWIERFEGAPEGSYGGVQGDGGPWYISLTGAPLPPEDIWRDPPSRLDLGLGGKVPHDSLGAPSDLGLGIRREEYRIGGTAPSAPRRAPSPHDRTIG